VKVLFSTNLYSQLIIVRLNENMTSWFIQ